MTEDTPQVNRPQGNPTEPVSPLPKGTAAKAEPLTEQPGNTLVEAPPRQPVTPAVPVTKHKKTRRQRRKEKRANRTMQDKATRTTWRSFIITLLPLIGIGITYYLYRTDEPKMTILVSAAATIASMLILAPFILWGAISSIRRGTRRMLLSLIMGFYSGFMTVMLLAALAGGILGYGILTGEPIPIIEQQIELPGNIR